MNETIRTILFRRSVRAYTDEPVPAELLDTILNCGIYAPSGGNHQEITLTALMNPSHIEALRMLVWQEFKKMEPKENQYMNIAVNNARTKKDYNFTFHAPVLVIASGPAGWPNGMADSALALGNVMLAATSLSLVSCYVNQLHWLDGNDVVRDYLAQLGLPREGVNLRNGRSRLYQCGTPQRCPTQGRTHSHSSLIQAHFFSSLLPSKMAGRFLEKYDEAAAFFQYDRDTIL